MLKTCILATYICKILLASRIVLRVRQLSSKGKSTNENHFDALICDLSVSWGIQYYPS